MADTFIRVSGLKVCSTTSIRFEVSQVTSSYARPSWVLRLDYAYYIILVLYSTSLGKRSIWYLCFFLRMRRRRSEKRPMSITELLQVPMHISEILRVHNKIALQYWLLRNAHAQRTITRKVLLCQNFDAHQLPGTKRSHLHTEYLKIDFCKLGPTELSYFNIV